MAVDVPFNIVRGPVGQTAIVSASGNFRPGAVFGVFDSASIGASKWNLVIVIPALQDVLMVSYEFHVSYIVEHNGPVLFSTE